MSIQSEIERIENNIAATYSNLEDMGADMPETQNSNNLPETVLTVKAVRYDEQSMSEAQKTQARNNIGAASSEEVSAISQEIVDKKVFVTPAMYGAKGDGITDDTEAIQSAMDSGYPVEFDSEKTYLASGFDINRDVVLNGNGATLLCTGKQQDTKGKFCFFVPEDISGETGLYKIHIDNFKINISNHIVGVLRAYQGNELTIKNCIIECNADLDPSVSAANSPGANECFAFYHFRKFEITGNIIKNVRGYAISAEEYNENGLIADNIIDNTGRGSIYVRAFNKNVEVTRNTIANSVRCFTVADGVIDLYGAGNEGIYISKNNIKGYGREGYQACGIRIKGSKNVVCSENTITTDSTTYSFALIVMQDRFEVGNENIIIENNHLYALEGRSGYVIRDDYDVTITKELVIRNNYLISDPNVCYVGISIRRSSNGLSINDNYIEGNRNLIEFYQTDGFVREKVLCNGNRMISKNVGSGNVVFYGSKDLKFTNNFILINKEDAPIVYFTNCSDVIIDMNSITNELSDDVIQYSNCSNVNTTDKNIFTTRNGVIDLKEYSFVRGVSGETELEFDALKGSVVGVEVFGYTNQTIEEGAVISPENLIEYTSANEDESLEITINGLVCEDSYVKRGLPANKDIANYIDSNGQGWISDYRDWTSGVDWHLVEEYILTGEETVRDYNEKTILVSWDELTKDKKSIGADYKYKYEIISNAFEYFKGDINAGFIRDTNAQGTSFEIRNYESYFTNAEGFKALCKTLYENGTPIKILYALKVPYTTPIDVREMEIYNKHAMSIGNNLVSNNKNLYIKIVYLLNDDYTSGAKNMIAAEIDKFTKGTVTEVLTGVQPIEVMENTGMRNNGSTIAREYYSVSIYDVINFVTNTIYVTYSVSSDIVNTPAFIVKNKNGEIIDRIMCATDKTGVYTEIYNIPEGASEIHVNTRMTQTQNESSLKNIVQTVEYDIENKFKDSVEQFAYNKTHVDNVEKRINEQIDNVGYHTVTTDIAYKHSDLPDGEKTITVYGDGTFGNSGYVCYGDDFIPRNTFNRTFPWEGLTIERNGMTYHATGTIGENPAQVNFAYDNKGDIYVPIDKSMIGKTLTILSFANVTGENNTFSVDFYDEGKTKLTSKAIYVGRYLMQKDSIEIPIGTSYMTMKFSAAENKVDLDLYFQVYVVLDESIYSVDTDGTTPLNLVSNNLFTMPYESNVSTKIRLIDYVNNALETYINDVASIVGGDA